VSRHQIILVAIVAIVAAVGGALLARSVVNAPERPAALSAATLLQPPRPIVPVELIDQVFDATRLKNRWSLLFFGFTNCPDICPQTLTVLAQVEKRLHDLPKSQAPQVVLVSVDPDRDTPEQIKKYVGYFSPSFVGVTGSSENVQAFAQALSAPVAIHPLGDGAYTVDHSAAIFLIDPDGALHALFSAPHDPSKIAADVRRIVGG
jgi:protein SCO1/2